MIPPKYTVVLSFSPPKNYILLLVAFRFSVAVSDVIDMDIYFDGNRIGQLRGMHSEIYTGDELNLFRIGAIVPIFKAVEYHITNNDTAPQTLHTWFAGGYVEESLFTSILDRYFTRVVGEVSGV